MVGVPLLIEEQMVGVLHVGTYDRRQFSTDDAQLLQTVADQTVAAIASLSELWKLAYSSVSS